MAKRKLTREEVATMWIHRDWYSRQPLGIVDFYKSLSAYEKTCITRFLAELDAVKKGKP